MARRQDQRRDDKTILDCRLGVYRDTLGASSGGSRGGSGRAFWAVQGGPGRHLGGSWGPLGAVLGGLGAILERLFEQSDFGSIF